MAGHIYNMDYFYYIGPWVWDTSEAEPYFRAPSGCIGLIDIRADASQTGNGFFSFSEPLADPTGYTAFGDGTKLNAYVLTTQERADWEALTGAAMRHGGDVHPLRRGRRRCAMHVWPVCESGTECDGIQAGAVSAK